jgi:hypothetical protein
MRGTTACSSVSGSIVPVVHTDLIVKQVAQKRALKTVKFQYNFYDFQRLVLTNYDHNSIR